MPDEPATGETTAAATVFEIGSATAGSGPLGARVDSLLGERDGPVGAAWAAAFAAGGDGGPVLAALQPGLPVRPFTLIVAKLATDGELHRRLVVGPVQAGVAAGVADAVAAEMLDDDEARRLLLVVAVHPDPGATDLDAVFTNHREATRAALVIGRADLPHAREAVRNRGEAGNEHFGPRT